MTAIEVKRSLFLTTSGAGAKPTAIERKIKRVCQDVLRMGALVEDSFRLSQQALFARDLSVLDRIATLEDRIDEFYHQIELDCVVTMTLNAPVAENCRWLSALMQLVRDLERIGDYAQDLAEIAVKLFPYGPHPHLADVESMARQTMAMLGMSLAALVEPDPEAGARLKEADNAVDEAYDRLYGLLANQRDVPGAIEPIVLMVLTIRHIERMADHATNIAQRASYIVTGHRQ
jgi:phosphate transport system protein